MRNLNVVDNVIMRADWVEKLIGRCDWLMRIGWVQAPGLPWVVTKYRYFVRIVTIFVTLLSTFTGNQWHQFLCTFTLTFVAFEACTFLLWNELLSVKSKTFFPCCHRKTFQSVHDECWVNSIITCPSVD